MCGVTIRQYLSFRQWKQRGRGRGGGVGSGDGGDGGLMTISVKNDARA